ncbi:MAG: membrane-bound lytic murein transglycosylase MltF [Burkholderiales bacterium]|nr:membrane-bound lytic murein transglycosylase MltF [Burkholderiales bacterium]
MSAYPLHLLWTTALVLALTLVGCGRKPPPPWQTGELVVLTRPSATTYYRDARGETVGFEHDLVRRFAEAQGWRVRFVPTDSLEQLFARLERGEAHLAAAGLTVSDGRLARLRFGPVYTTTREWVVCGPAADAVARVEDLPGRRIEVVAHSSHVESLRQLRVRHPRLAWRELNLPGEEELLERVAAGLADCTVADELELKIARNFYPGLRAAFALGGERRVAWAFPRRTDARLIAAVGQFFRDLDGDDTIALLQERYYGHITRLAQADVLGILEKRTSRLPALKPYFYEGQRVSGIDWRLLAAVAYQESQWDARAVSPTGVRGIMMLTAETADRLGVRDRLDARESILGGARYLRMLIDMVPAQVPEPDRTWMALAAYNIGPGHFAATLRLAERLERNPHAWRDVKDVLPKLARSRHEGEFRYANARGGEARAFAENVRVYYDILARYEPPYREVAGL